MTKYTHRIRRAKGRQKGWCLVALRDDGSEMDHTGYTSARTIDGLLQYSGGLLPSPEDVVQIVYYEEEQPK